MEEQVTKSMPLLGDRFPEVEVTTTHGRMVLPKAYEGKWFVLFSHPGDFTPVCTTEFIAFASAAGEFSKLNCELIGLSIDQVFSHIKWVEWIKEKMGVEVKFPVIADGMGRLASMLGMIHPNKGGNTVRAVFVVDPSGSIRLILYYPQEIGRNINEILRVVRALQTADKHNVATPANWPENAILKDRVIIPPATDEKTAKERLKKFECFDWWFCNKKL
jgi:peroxiredoxin (alkyl hydroperoxide reductase subunit C)